MSRRRSNRRLRVVAAHEIRRLRDPAADTHTRRAPRLLPPTLSDKLVSLICKALLGFLGPGGQQIDNFLLHKYSPAFRNLTSAVKLSTFERLGLFLRVGGTGVKLLWAFVWQERVTQGDRYLNDADVNELGGLAMPYVNMLANAMTGFKHTDGEVQHCKDVYPGDQQCRVGPSPHAKWHEASGNGLLDLILLADDFNGLLRSKLPHAADSPARWPMLEALKSSWFGFWSAASPLDAARSEL